MEGLRPPVPTVNDFSEPTPESTSEEAATSESGRSDTDAVYGFSADTTNGFLPSEERLRVLSELSTEGPGQATVDLQRIADDLLKRKGYRKDGREKKAKKVEGPKNKASQTRTGASIIVTGPKGTGVHTHSAENVNLDEWGPNQPKSGNE